MKTIQLITLFVPLFTLLSCENTMESKRKSKDFQQKEWKVHCVVNRNNQFYPFGLIGKMLIFEILK